VGVNNAMFAPLTPTKTLPLEIGMVTLLVPFIKEFEVDTIPVRLTPLPKR
jgi:hypothetical protein